MEASGVNRKEPEKNKLSPSQLFFMTKGKAERTFARRTNFVAKSIRVRNVSSN